MLAETELAEIASGAEGRLSVRFADGRSQDTEAVLAALGIARNTGLAEEAGVAVDGGVLVDAAMALLPSAPTGRRGCRFCPQLAAGRRLRVEHWGEALNMGEVAGRTMAGVEAGWGVAPGFWSTIGERTMKYAGWGDGWDEMIFEDGKGESFAAWYGRDREIVGVARPRSRRATSSSAGGWLRNERHGAEPGSSRGRLRATLLAVEGGCRCTSPR